MVRCMYKGVVWNTSKDEEVKGEEEVGVEGNEADRLVLQYRLASQHIKVVEDEFDNDGRPKVKIIYVDMGAYPWKGSLLKRYSHIFSCVVEWEKMQAAKLHRVGPRLIFVMQDRDFWPDSEDPECALRAKEKMEKSIGYPEADYRSLCVYDMDRRPTDMKKYFLSLHNTELPGGRFIAENLHPFDYHDSGECWSSDDD